MEILDRILRIMRSNLVFSSDYEKETHSKFNKHQSYKNAEDEKQNGFKSNQTDEFINPELAQYYANLEVPCGSDLNTVRKSWKRLVKKYHPDLHSSDLGKQKTANELVQGLNRAFENIKQHLANSKEERVL